jgi:CheY-like chemotaxis protein
VRRQGNGDVVVSFLEPVDALGRRHRPWTVLTGIRPLTKEIEIMEPAPPDGLTALPEDVLIVEDDPIIALDFEDTILGFGVKKVRSAGNVARALQMIAERAPDFALLDVGLVREKSFAIAERLDALKIPFVFVTGYGVDVRLPAALADRPRLVKPYSTPALHAALSARSDGT